MPKSWDQVMATPQYKSWSEGERKLAKKQYFDEVVRPQIAKQDHAAAWKQFEAYVGQRPQEIEAEQPSPKPQRPAVKQPVVQKDIYQQRAEEGQQPSLLEQDRWLLGKLREREAVIKAAPTVKPEPVEVTHEDMRMMQRDRQSVSTLSAWDALKRGGVRAYYNQVKALKNANEGLAKKYEIYGMPDMAKKVSDFNKSDPLIRNIEKLQPKNIGTLKGYKKWVNDAFETVTQVAIQAPLAAANPVVSAGFMGTQIQVSTEEALKQDNWEGVPFVPPQTDAGRARYAGFKSAIGQSALETVGIGKLLKYIKPVKGLKGKALAVAKASFAEAATEFLQTYPGLWAEVWAETPGKTHAERMDRFWEGFGEATKEGLYEASIGAVLGGGPVTVTQTANIITNSLKRYRRKKAAQPSKTSHTGFLSEAEIAESVLEQTTQDIKKGEKVNLGTDQKIRDSVLALQVDPVSGFHESRANNARINTVKRAKQFIKENPQHEANYVEMDLKNLGGINMEYGASDANKIYRKLSDFVSEELGELEADVSKFRHGGDELSAVVVGSNKAEVETALMRAIARADQWASKTVTPTGKKLSDIPHAKAKKDLTKRGTGFTISVQGIDPSIPTEKTISIADKRLELRKQGKDNEYNRQIDEAKLAASEGRPRGVDQEVEGRPEGIRPDSRTTEEAAKEQAPQEIVTEHLRGKFQERYDTPTRNTRQNKETPQPPKNIPDHQQGGTELYGGIPINKAGKPLGVVGRGLEKILNKIWIFSGDFVFQKQMDHALTTLGSRLVSKFPRTAKVIHKPKEWYQRLMDPDFRGDLSNPGEFNRNKRQMERFQSIGREYALDIGNRLSVLPEQHQMLIGEFLRADPKNKPKLPPNLHSLAKEAQNALIRLGEQMVDVGLLNEKTFFKNIGQYFPRLYKSKEQHNNLFKTFGIVKPKRLDLARVKKRKEIDKAIREQMGEILTPGYPVAKGITQLTHDIEMAKFFRGIANNPEWSLPHNTKQEVPDGWVQTEDNAKLGALRKAHVHPEIARELDEMIKVRTKIDKAMRKALGMWKFGKVILSPKTHFRNWQSNSILAHMGGMPLYEQPFYYDKAFKSLKKRDAYWKAAKEEGLLDTTYTQGELGALLDQIEFEMKGVKGGGWVDKMTAMGAAFEKAKSGARWAADKYEGAEHFFKMMKFIHNVEIKKMNAQDAAADAEKWLFNYSKLTKFQENWRSKWYGAPFAVFQFKAMPRLIESTIKTPWRLALPGALIYGLQEYAREYIGDDEEREQAKKELRQDWMQGSYMGIPNFARVPIVDEHGREYYLNLSYILPWGDLADRENPLSGIAPLEMPLVKVLGKLKDNYNPFWGQKIVKLEDIRGLPKGEQAVIIVKKMGIDIGADLTPTLAMDIIKGIQSIGGKMDYRGRVRPFGVVVLDALAGIKMYPVDYSESVARVIRDFSPDKRKGDTARKIHQQIKTFSVKRHTLMKKGRSTKYWDEQIDLKKRQLEGLAKDMKDWSPIIKKAMGK